LASVDVGKVVVEAMAHLEAPIQEAKAEVELEPPFPALSAHYPTLVQVVGNLLSNAVKFVAPGVRPKVRLSMETSGNVGRLWVYDNGIGIAPEFHARIFRVFERLHGLDAYPGSGVGLAIVRKGVERMGGRVGVESAAGQGSRFWFELPLARPCASKNE
jgi:signal transduction histidine kinase